MLPVFQPQDIEKRIGVPIPYPTITAMYPYVFDIIKDTGRGTLLVGFFHVVLFFVSCFLMI